MDMAQTHQMRPPGETRWYAPARDISCFTPQAVRAALEVWEEHSNKALHSDEDVAKVCEALAAFCSEECLIDSETCEEAYQMSGLHDAPPELMSCIMALIGEQFLSAFWVGIRGATSADKNGKFEIIQYDPAALVDASQKMAKLMRMPRWRRGLHLKWDAVRRFLINKLRGESE